MLRDAKSGIVQGLTTAATVWVTAALGICLRSGGVALLGIVGRGADDDYSVRAGPRFESQIFPDNDEFKRQTQRTK